jgi:hypothetical protein
MSDTKLTISPVDPLKAVRDATIQEVLSHVRMFGMAHYSDTVSKAVRELVGDLAHRYNMPWLDPATEDGETEDS